MLDGEDAALPSTREVLIEHLYTVVRELVPHLADKVTGMFVDCPTSMVTALLEDKKLLAQRVDEAVEALRRNGETGCPVLSDEKQQLGDELFEKVAEIESELCAQVTGMLLEMSETSIQHLLDDSSRLERAVARARMEYLKEHHPASLPSREELGEELFESVTVLYPEEASRVTGMLLELDLDEIQQLVDNPDLLRVKAELAVQTIRSCGTHLTQDLDCH